MATITKSIVAIEDEPSIADLLNFVLESSQLAVNHCSDGKEGLETIFKVKPDLVIMDVMLPSMDGWQVYDAIRSDPTVKATPVLMLSVTGPEFERKDTFRRSSIDFYMNKPFDARVLRRKVEEILGQEIWTESDKT